ncbi:hypothetical protein [Rhodovulum sp. ES.010]|uniref:hypothetical protein n=1 Tax=Rhodovulum sp. ES.010 TaxID=1882821 RepID=UPI00111512ED|nr:hypothetical protein [Rhodovulum sp. ES.010]
MIRLRRASVTRHILLAAALLLAWPFLRYSVEFGVGGLAGNLAEPTYLFRDGAWASKGAIFLHMLAGAAITILAPL